MKHYQELRIRYMGKTDRIQINDMRFKNKMYIPSETGNVLTDTEKFLNAYNYKVIGYSSNFESATYTMFIENRLDKNSFRKIEKGE